MSWTDPCGNCGEHRAACTCKHYSSIENHNCEYCEEECKKKNTDSKIYESCQSFKLAKR